MAGKQIGNNFTGALFNDFAVVKQRKFHTFRIAVNGLAVGAVEGVEGLRIGFEVYCGILQPAFRKKAFDDPAADAVGCGVKGYAHGNTPWRFTVKGRAARAGFTHLLAPRPQEGLCNCFRQYPQGTCRPYVLPIWPVQWRGQRKAR